MTELFLVLNVAFAWYGLKSAKQDFEQENNVMGWIWIVVSAWNTAAFMNMVF